MKVVIIGDPKMGKTTLRRAFSGEEFRSNYLPTLGADFSITKILRNNQRYVFTLWDLSGQKQYFNVHPQYYVGSHGAIVVVDVHTENAIERITAWVDKYVEYAGKYSGPIMVLMNKIDVLPPQEEMEAVKEFETILEHLDIYYHNKFEIIGEMTSAKTAENVQDSFNRFFEELINHYQDPSQPFSRKLRTTREHPFKAYLIKFDEMQGPVIVSSYPLSPNEYSSKELSSAMRLSTDLNFEELISVDFQSGIATWSEPLGSIAYIAFVLPRPDDKERYDLFIIGVTIKMEYRQLVQDKFSIVEGYLSHQMKQFHDFITSNDIQRLPGDLMTSDSEMFNFIISSYLENLSNKVAKLIQEKSD